VYVGLAGPDTTRAERLALSGDRAGIRARACTEALALLVAALR
jgi:nicotinamide mononucleotide (NMN) deamidase PncC